MNAIEKLTQEMEKANEMQKTVAQYLVTRCEKSKALCEDILKPDKTFAKCWEYIYGQARKNAKNGAFCEGGEDDSTSKVFEWAEDYYHAQNLDIDKPKPKTEAPKYDVKKAIANAQANATKSAPKKPTPQKKATITPITKKPSAPKTVAKPKDDGEQFSLFDLM